MTCAFFKALFALVSYFVAGILWDYRQTVVLNSGIQKYLLLGSTVLFALCLGWFANVWLALAVVLVTGDVFFILISRRLKWLLATLMVVKFKPKTFPPQDIEKNLQALGMEAKAIKKIADTAAVQDEVVIAEWGAEDKLYSHFGKIPAIAEIIEDIQNFKPRGLYRNCLQLVIFKQQVAIKKCFFCYSRFLNEAFALIKLKNSSNVPVLFGLWLSKKTLYRPLVDADNLGSHLEKAGLSLKEQRLLDKLPIFRRAEFKQSLEYPKRHDAIGLVNSLFSRHNLKENLRALLTELHLHNISYGDIWYSNILLLKPDKQPYLSDFDLSNWYPVNHDFFRLARIEDWKRFNLLFDGKVPVPDQLDELFTAYTADFLELRANKRILFPHGQSLGKGSFFDSPTWLWPFISAKLPTTAPRFIHLGIQTGAMAVQGLRCGVKDCVILESRVSYTACAKFLLDAYQVLDNRRYAVDFSNLSATDIANVGWKNAEVVCCFGGFDDVREDEIIAALSSIPTTVACVVLEGRAAIYSKVLEKHGFKVNAALKFPFSTRQFVFAYPIAVSAKR